MAEYNKSMPIRRDEPLDSEDKSQLIGTSSTNIKFTQNVIGLEVANDSDTTKIYLRIDGSTATTTSGMPIPAGQVYTADKKIDKDTGISIISTEANTQVNIIGHFNLDVEEGS